MIHECFSAVAGASCTMQAFQCCATAVLLYPVVCLCLCRMQRRSEAELEALALYMGHSLEMQRGTYDRRSKDQKVAPAQQLLQQLARQGKKGD